MWFDFGGVWSNFLLDQPDETVCYNTVSNEFSCSSGVNNGGCSGGVTVCGNGDECGGIVTLQQQQLQTQQCNMENSVFNNNHNNNNYNNNSNYNTAINNDVGCEKNFQNYQRRNFYTNPACHNEFVYEQQQQTQQQFSYQRPHCSYNNSHDNFMNVPQHQRQQQQQHQQQVLYSCEINAQQKLQHAQQQHFQPAAPSHDVQHQHQPQHQYQFNQHSLVERTASNPCQGNPPWTYAYCFGYGPYVNQGPCQLTQVVDIEDFMYF